MSDKMTVHIERDEWYPVYIMLPERPGWDAEVVTTVPVELYERYERLLAEFTDVQDEIEKIFNNVREKS